MKGKMNADLAGFSCAKPHFEPATIRSEAERAVQVAPQTHKYKIHYPLLNFNIY
jgi:hypothetical protein